MKHQAMFAGLGLPLLLLTLAACGRETPTPPSVPEAAQGPAVRFPTSADGEAQAAFLRGVRALHCFEYPRARKAFREARGIRPGFVLATWGEAMTWFRLLWGEEDVRAAREVLATLGETSEARAAVARTSREKSWLATVEALAGPGSKAERRAAHEDAMAALVEAHPDDFEARAFHALAVLGTAQGVRHRPTYDRAAALLEPLFAQRPDHFGVSHYLVHCYDDPEHAHLALEAARALAKAAPDSSHALHMASHIFLPLGRWDDVVSSNVAAWDASGASNHHALHWLAYARLQLGDTEAAREALETMQRDAARIGTPKARLYLALMRATYLVNTPACARDVREVPVALDGLRVEFFAAHHLADGLCAWRAEDAAGIDAARDRLGAAIAALPEEPTDRTLRHGREVAEIAHGQLEALGLLAAGDEEGAVSRLRALAGVRATMPAEFGPPTPPKPVEELLGDVLLARERPGAAVAAYRDALERHPGRRQSLHGLLHAARAAEDGAQEAWAEEQIAAHGVGAP